MALPIGWYTDPTPGNENLCLLWDGKTVAGPLAKTDALRYCAENGQPAPIFMAMEISPVPASSEPVAVTAVPAREQLMMLDASNAGWLRTTDVQDGGQGMLMAYWDGSGTSEYFSGEALINEVALPEFIRQGGSPDWWGNGAQEGTADYYLFWTVFNRITPEQAKGIIGETASVYNNGPTWIADKDNPNLARWWDGRAFTGETELFGVIQQRSFDAENGNTDTVSYAPGLPGSEAGSWHTDPADPTHLIRWGGARWDKRRSVEDTIHELFTSLGEPVPAMWSGTQSMSARHSDLISQLVARKNGVNGWYKEPEHFDDLRMRVWHEGQWTDQTSQQVPGLYDDPFNDEILREWNNGWTNKTVTKEAERVRLEREALRQEKRRAFAEKALVAVADYYSPENTRKRRIEEQNDRSRRLRDAASAAALEHHEGANNYWAQKAHDRRWK